MFIFILKKVLFSGFILSRYVEEYYGWGKAVWLGFWSFFDISDISSNKHFCQKNFKQECAKNLKATYKVSILIPKIITINLNHQKLVLFCSIF